MRSGLRWPCRNVRVLEESRRLVERLQNALDERKVVERAVRIMIGRS